MNKYITKKNGAKVLLLLIISFFVATALLVLCINIASPGAVPETPVGEQVVEYNGALVAFSIISYIIYCIIFIVLLCGFKIVKPNQARVLTLFGKYYGTISENGFYHVNPFCISEVGVDFDKVEVENTKQVYNKYRKYISLKELTLANERQKVNDADGNPVEIGVVVIWKVVDPYKAVFNVENYKEYLSMQSDGVIRNVARTYPYDVSDENDDEKTLRGSTVEISKILKDMLSEKVEVAGIEIVEARISHLAYAVEIASAMLQRQQAKAIVDARTQIVNGAVSMVDMALEQLSEKEIVDLDEERKAQMVSNLLVVLCSNKDTQPIVNSGSIY
ncbi:MAG: SPFH domain-containing protein [Lachnospirales bacterium]